MFLLLNCARGLLVLLCCVHPFLHNKELKDRKPKSLCFSPFTPVLGRVAGFAGWTEVVLTSVAPIYLPTSLSWLTGYSSLEKSGLKDASPSGAFDLPLFRL